MNSSLRSTYFGIPVEVNTYNSKLTNETCVLLMVKVFFWSFLPFDRCSQYNFTTKEGDKEIYFYNKINTAKVHCI